jgi:hypothetical protein
VSPCRVRMSAIRSMVALRPDGVPGGGPGDDQLQAGFGCASQPHEPLGYGCGGLVFGAGRVGLEDLGFQQGMQPSPRDCSD